MRNGKTSHIVAENDRNAFGQLYRQHRRMLLGYAVGLLAGDLPAAEDVVDDAFLDIWKKASRNTKQGSEACWMRRIVRNKTIDWLRKYGDTKIDSHSIPDGMDESSTANPEELASKASDGEWLRAALSRLSFDHRETMQLFYYEEMSLSKIAKITNCPENTVKTRLHYGRRALMKQREALVD